MKVEEIKDYMIDLYRAGNSDLFPSHQEVAKTHNLNGGSILLLGPPGIGKTTGVVEGAQEIAELLKREFVDYDDSVFEKIVEDPVKYFLYVENNLNDCEPSDLTGIPKENERGIYYKPFLWARALSLPGTAGICCLDEFTNIQRLDVITASYKIVLDHKAGFTKFTDRVMIAATGNSPEESTVANLLPVPLVDRFTIYKVQRPELTGWAAWMDRHYGDKWEKRSLAYLMHFRDEFLDLPSETETLDNFPTPRSWTKVSILLPNIANTRWRETAIGSLGPATGEKFFGFLHKTIPDITELLKQPEKFNELEMDAKYLASVLVGTDLKNRLENAEEEKKKEEEIEKTLPIFRVMKDLQQDFMILATISGGEKQRTDIIIGLGRKDKEIAKIYEQVATLRTKLEV